ncbi:MAG: hypothetical protein ACJATC_002306, partial [Neptuniibacter pectenicola]
MLSQSVRSMCGCFLILCCSFLSLQLNAATVTYDFSGSGHTA